MKKLIISVIISCLGIFASGTISALAETYGNLYYEVTNSEITITDADEILGEKTINIPSSIDGYPVTSIGRGAFERFGQVTSITIPSTVVTIGERAFANCDSLTGITIPNSVQTIEEGAFFSCDGLKSINIPKSVTVIGDEAFGSCANLTSISVNTSNPNYSSSNGVLYDKQKTVLIQFPSKKSSISIPQTVTSIGKSAFSDSKISSVKFPTGIKSIGENGFSSCYYLYDIEIPDSVESIGAAAFWMCTGLQEVNIPKSVTAIESETFSDCTSLSKIYIPENITQIGISAFYNCISLTAIDVDKANLHFAAVDGILYNKDKTTLVKCPAGKTNISILDTVIEISAYAFESCIDLTSVIFHDGLVKIGNKAFDNCANLKEITIPTSVTYIGGGVFINCPKITDIYYLGKESQWNRIDIGGNNANITKANIHFVGSAHFEAVKVKRSTRTNCRYSFTIEGIRNGEFIIAGFDESHRFLGCDIQSITDSDIQVAGEVILVDRPSYYRAFAWESITNQEPIGNMVTGEIL